MPHQGKCLCGKVTVSLEEDFKEQVMCHCKDCQQTSGSAFSTNVLAQQSKVKITGATAQYDAKAASGNTVSRIFCSNCGAAVSHKSVAFGDKQAIQTGLFADFAKIPVALELFVKDRWTGLADAPGAKQVQTM